MIYSKSNSFTEGEFTQNTRGGDNDRRKRIFLSRVVSSNREYRFWSRSTAKLNSFSSSSCLEFEGIDGYLCSSQKCGELFYADMQSNLRKKNIWLAKP